MKFDPYTKALLTIIALCLIWICVKDANFVSSAHADTSREPAAVVASTVVAPNEIVSFQLAWNERTDTGLFNYRVQNEVRDRRIRVRTLRTMRMQCRFDFRLPNG